MFRSEFEYLKNSKFTISTKRIYSFVSSTLIFRVNIFFKTILIAVSKRRSDELLDNAGKLIQGYKYEKNTEFLHVHITL